MIPARRIHVDIGRERAAAPPPPARPRLVVVGVVGEGSPRLGDTNAALRVRETRYNDPAVGAEHLRWGPGMSVASLPGLDAPMPSRVRDSVRLALAAGAPSVEVLLARFPGSVPHRLAAPALAPVFAAMMEELPAAVLLYPDASGPPVVGPEDPLTPAQRAQNVAQVLRAHAAGWRTRYQVGLLDVSELPGAEIESLVRQHADVDAALCTWEGPDAAMDAQGWRCAAAVVGGALASLGDAVVRGIDGVQVALPPGRPQAAGRRLELGLVGARPPRGVPAPVVGVSLREDRRAHVARIHGEPTLRAPLGEWGLASLRTVKILHMLVVQAAEAFVFRPVDQAQAIGLMTALDYVLRPFVSAGLLVGPRGEGSPVVQAEPVPDPNAPALLGTIEAQLRPWCREIRLRVGVRGHQHPRLEVLA